MSFWLPATPMTANPAPDVVPIIREWIGGSGDFELGASSRIVVDSSDLLGEAQLLHDDIAAVTGLDVKIATDRNPHRGDLVLSDRGAPTSPRSSAGGPGAVP
jgi:Glycosyl hydrolase family 20, domain 2